MRDQPITFFFNDSATTEIYTLSLHDALPISSNAKPARWLDLGPGWEPHWTRSEEHTSELQSHHDLVCRLLLEKKNRSPSLLLTVQEVNVQTRVHFASTTPCLSRGQSICRGRH